MPTVARPAQHRKVNTTLDGRPVTIVPDALKPTERVPVATSKVNTGIREKPARGRA